MLNRLFNVYGFLNISICFIFVRYIRKPDFMCRTDRSFDPFAESTVDGIIAGSVEIRVSKAKYLCCRLVTSMTSLHCFQLSKVLFLFFVYSLICSLLSSSLVIYLLWFTFHVVL